MRDCAGVRCGKAIDGDDVMLLVFSVSEGASPLEAAGAEGLVFVDREGGRRGCFDGEEPPLPLPANAEREALDTADLGTNPAAPSPSPVGRGVGWPEVKLGAPDLTGRRSGGKRLGWGDENGLFPWLTGGS